MTMHDALTVRFWGVRGSIPSPGADTALVGGNTACVEVTGGGTRLILDAGSGLRGLGDMLMKEKDSGPHTLLLSHVHWDHIMGLPFFVPLYMPQTKLALVSQNSEEELLDVLRQQMKSPLFPVSFDSLPSHISTAQIPASGRMRIGALEVRCATLHHPDPVLAFRISYGGRSVVYATDTEHRPGEIDETLVRLARSADVLIYDAQYTPEEFPSRVGWGHSTFEAGAAIARAAQVKTLALFHHDPNRTDEQVGAIVQRAKSLFPGAVAAREGLSFRLECTPSMQQQALG